MANEHTTSEETSIDGWIIEKERLGKPGWKESGIILSGT